MKICILTPRFPFPENGGDVLRINEIARYLKSKGHVLCLCSFYDKDFSDKNLSYAKELYDVVYTVKRSKLVSMINSLLFFIIGKPIQCGYYHSRKFNKLFRKVILEDNADLYISHLLRMTPYLERNNLINNSIIEMTDALSKTYSLSSTQKRFSLKKIIYKFEKNRIKKYEQNIISNFPKVVLVSQKDIEYLGNHINTKLHTNGINCIENNVKINNKKICFVGNMRTLQNQDAVKYFIEEILPLIKKDCENVEFHIVGAQPPVFIQNYNDGKSIFVTGFVDSVEEYIKDATMIVAPVKIAAGIQNKVLIGMGCKIPVIMTSLISKAIPELKNEENCFIADNPSDFANACIKLMKNEELRNTIAEKGYEVMKNFYSWNSKLEGYEVF